ncbi:MAG TPA: peptidoglycan DD-metalloendopeptidase family protein [Chitinophagaceae bacterium]|jgi:septal ring factor EnvC (AmiA/AmiB activator)|nr:peptidoglycan DD-metalloendopeptidase family protein [Chitinophagaceae bacterium]
MKKRIYFFFAFVLSSCFLLAQTEDKTQLEKERQEIQKEIKEIQGEYDKLKGKTKQIVGQYNLIDRKIKLQNKYISNISKELRMIDDDIYLSNVEIYRLSKLLDTLRAQYSRSVVYAYKNRSNYDFLNFIFSAGSFNDAIKRITYLRSYRAYREQQVNTIKETQALIAKRKQDQLSKKKQKDDVLENQTEQARALEGQKKEKDVVLNQLKSQEKDLQKQLTAKKKKDRDLQNAITSIINREIAAARAAAKKKADEEAIKNPKPVTTDPNVSKNTTTNAKPNIIRESVVFNTEADLKLNIDFEKNRMKLPWPVDQGTVCIHYGPYQIGDTKLKGDNPGITICTPQPGNNVKSVFDGEVARVFYVGDSKSVMIRHGKYFTVYSNLSSVTVERGANVSTGQSIGKVGVDEETGEGGKLEFLLMVENKKLNPEQWLHK